jgi:hypothetical protein
MWGIPWWLTAAAGIFCLVFAVLSVMTNGVGGEFLFFAFLGALFIGASLMRQAWLRDILMWVGSIFRS